MATATEVTNYQFIIGSLLYLMIGTRHDIAYSVTHLSQFCTNPSMEHYKAALHICQYLVGTQEFTPTVEIRDWRHIWTPMGLLSNWQLLEAC